MSDETKDKLHIKPRGSKTGPSKGGAFKEMEELIKEVRKLKKQVGRLLNIAEHEENIVQEHKGKPINLKLVDGSEETGVLKEITKFQIVIEQDESANHYYKSAIVKYYF